MDKQHHLKKIIVPVHGMHCASCATTIEKTLRKSDGVEACDVNVGTEKATITFDPGETDLKTLSEKIERFGYTLTTDNAYQHGSHRMSDGSMMMDHEMSADEDHSAHLGLNQTKDQKLAELDRLKKKIYVVMPITLLTFFLMMWEIAAMNIMSVPSFPIPEKLFVTFSFIVASVVMFWIGRPFIIAVGRFIKTRTANMDSLVGIGTLTAYIYSSVAFLFPEAMEQWGLAIHYYFDVTVVVVGFIVYGKYLESRSKLRTGEAIEKLLNLQAKTALVQRGDEFVEISIDQVVEGDIIQVKPGGKIPVDGKIIAGRTSIDESMITGESLPIDKAEGDVVIGGTINKQGAFTYSATKVGSQTLLAQIIRMVEEAQGSRAPIQRLADQVAAIFTPTVMIIAVVTLLSWLVIGPQFMPFSQAFSYGLSSFVGVLIIACPCALGLATPTAIIVGTGKGAENGILIKDAESLERLHKITTIVTDKTGTITNGTPEVTDIMPLAEIDTETMLSILGSLEAQSEHPLAVAIVKAAKNIRPEHKQIEQFSNLEGKGLTGIIDGVQYFAGNVALMNDLSLTPPSDTIEQFSKQGKTPVLLATHTQIIAAIGIADTLKDNAKDTIRQLHTLGMKIILLSGDNRQTAQHIAQQVGIDEVIAEVLPNQKAEKIKQLQSKGEHVAMLGDGVNDAPALAQADVGIAMGTGTDVAIESANLTLLRGDLSKLIQAIRLSRATMRTIRQNLFWAFIYNIIGIPVAAGLLYPFFQILLNPAFAGLAMAFSSVSVVTNSLRLKFSRL